MQRARLGTFEGVRAARIKVSPADAEADYHCGSKTVNGEFLFNDRDKRTFRTQLWQVADFCGVQVLTYTILCNHFHIVVRVPRSTPVSDTELVRRYHVLHPQPTKWASARIEAIIAGLKHDTPAAQAWRQRQLRLMGDVSQFMKLLKQRFSVWYNQTHKRFGPVWCDRFHSNLLGPGALEVAVTYDDLNCVRAGIVTDPIEYPFCGYAEAVAGNASARLGLQAVFGGSEWDSVQASYRERLFGVGGADAKHIPLRKVRKVFAEGGVVPLPTLLRCRQRYLTRGAIFGTREFVTAHAPPAARRHASHAVPRWSTDCEFAVLRAVRGPAIG